MRTSISGLSDRDHRFFGGGGTGREQEAFTFVLAGEAPMQNLMSCAWLAGVWAVRVGGELVFGVAMCFTRKKRVKTANRGHLARNIIFVAVGDERPVESSTLF